MSAATASDVVLQLTEEQRAELDRAIIAFGSACFDHGAVARLEHPKLQAARDARQAAFEVVAQLLYSRTGR